MKRTATAKSTWNAAVIGASVALYHQAIVTMATLLNPCEFRALVGPRNWFHGSTIRISSRQCRRFA
jgi:hypothetical protein